MALLARLTGPDGHVTDIGILPAAADRAGEHLAAAGYGNVQVIAGDGALGYAPTHPMTGASLRPAPGTWPLPGPGRPLLARDDDTATCKKGDAL